MANGRLTAEPSLCNDIAELTQCFKCSFEYHLKSSVISLNEYICALRTVVGLGFTAVLVDNSFLVKYQSHLQAFLNHDAGNFRHRIEAKTAIAQSIAEMVHLAIPCFYRLNLSSWGNPIYYSAFLLALDRALHGLMLTEHYQKVNDFLDHLGRI